MAESKKKDVSSVSSKKKDALEDLDIGKDFLSSWKSMSMADGDALDFDLAPASKGKKKPFEFDKADMDFNFDDDFGKMSNFNMDMSDFDISPPLKKDGKSKEKSKESSSKKDTGSSFDMEDMPDLDISPPLKRGDKSKEKSKDPSSGKHTGSSFNMDMSELDISPPFKKDGKSNEKSKESSSGKDTGKSDRFAFAFDFDELDNLDFGSSLTKEDPKAQREKNTKESSPDRRDCQDKDVSQKKHMNATTSMSTLEDGSQKPSLPENRITLDMNCLVGGSVDLEPTRKTSYSNLAMDDAVTTEHSAAIHEVESDKSEVLPEKTNASCNSRSIELVSHGPVDLEACNGNDAVKELSSDYPSNNEPSGGNSSEAQSMVDSMHANVTGSNDKQDANVISVVGSTCSTLSINSENLQTVAIAENINTENICDLGEDHVIDDRGKAVLGQINSLVENPSTATTEMGVLRDTQSGRESLDSSRTQKFSLVSKTAALKEKQTDNGRESLVNSTLPSSLQEKPECPQLKVSTQATFSSLSSKRMGFAQPSLVEGRRDENTSCQSDKKLVSLSLQNSKAQLRGEPPQIRSQENCNGVKTSGEMGNYDGLQNGKNMKVSFETQIKDMVITKPAMRKRETSMKDLGTLSLDINKKAAKTSEKPTTLTSISTKKGIPLEEHRLSSTEGGKRTPDPPKPKLTGLSLDSIKSPIQKDSKSVGNGSQKSTLLRKFSSDIAHFPNTTQKQTPSTLSIKRTLEDTAANRIALYPSKRPSLSASTSRDHVDTSAKVLNKKVPSHNHMGDDRVINTTDNCRVNANHLPHDVKSKGMGISFSIQNDSNIKRTDAYSKELDVLCNILKKKQDDGKEILARAIVNSNKLLMLNNPQFQDKIRATQDMFARLTLNSVHG